MLQIKCFRCCIVASSYSYARIYLLGGRRIGVFKIYQSRKRLFLCLLLQYDARDHKNHFIRVLCTRRSTSLDMRACVACLSCGYASKRNFPNVSFDKPQKFVPSSLSWQWCDVFFCHILHMLFAFAHVNVGCIYKYAQLFTFFLY